MHKKSPLNMMKICEIVVEQNYIPEDLKIYQHFIQTNIWISMWWNSRWEISHTSFAFKRIDNNANGDKGI